MPFHQQVSVAEQSLPIFRFVSNRPEFTGIAGQVKQLFRICTAVEQDVLEVLCNDHPTLEGGLVDL